MEQPVVSGVLYDKNQAKITVKGLPDHPGIAAKVFIPLSEAGISVACVQRFAGQMPILGVCLGHQSIGQATGSTIVRAKRLMHGKTDDIHHDGTGLFQGLPNPFTATRYHSLVIQPDTLSDCFVVNAWCPAPDGSREIMGIRHLEYSLIGLQFHPERLHLIYHPGGTGPTIHFSLIYKIAGHLISAIWQMHL